MDAVTVARRALALVAAALATVSCGRAHEDRVCEPGSTEPCYSGPEGTAGIGVCQVGQRICVADGQSYGACLGEVVPRAEDCHTAADESCDGVAPTCVPVADLRADTNRSGSVEMDDPTEDTGEDDWTAEHGAVLVANIDDDESRCPTSGKDAELAACNDAADEVVNGDRDLLDMAPLRIAPWPEAPADARATLAVTPAGAPVRFFRRSGDAYELFDPGAAALPSADLRAGVELRLEARDFVRDRAAWDGFVDVGLDLHGGTGEWSPLPDASDRVRLRVAPVMFRHHLDPADTVYATKITGSSAAAFFAMDMRAAVGRAGVPNGYFELAAFQDPWTQDFFETAFTAMPEPGGGMHVVHVNFRSSDFYREGKEKFRAGGRIVFTTLRGRDVAGAAQAEPHDPDMDSLDAFGNLETIPPYEHAGKRFPLGRVLRGDVPSMHPDPSFGRMIEAQGAQPMVRIDTSWLLVGHADETLSFVKAPTPRGWAVMVSDPAMAHAMLQAERDAGHGGTTVFEGKGKRQTTIAMILDNADIMAESAMAEAEVKAQVDVLRAEIGITDAELIPAAFLVEPAYGYAVAYQPGVVNGIYLSDTHFGAPDPHGPVIGGVDIFRRQLEQALMPFGVTVDWVEDWALLHIGEGEVHCGSNTKRQVPASEVWWRMLP